MSDPLHPSYGHFLSKAEVDALTAPAAGDMALVFSGWLHKFPLQEVAVGHHTIEVRCNVSVCERMLQTRFHKHQEEQQHASPTARNRAATLRAGPYVGRKSPLATKNLLEVTDGLRRPPF